MIDERIPKKSSNRKFRNKRPLGKIRKREENVVWMDTSQILGFRGWRRRVEDRADWRCFPRKAKGL